VLVEAGSGGEAEHRKIRRAGHSDLRVGRQRLAALLPPHRGDGCSNVDGKPGSIGGRRAIGRQGTRIEVETGRVLADQHGDRVLGLGRVPGQCRPPASAPVSSCACA